MILDALCGGHPMGRFLPCPLLFFVWAASASASNVTISDAQRTPEQLAQCYADRYEDLHREFCSSPGGCDVNALGSWSLRNHFERYGRSEGRYYGCSSLCAAGTISEHAHAGKHFCCAARCGGICGDTGGKHVLSQCCRPEIGGTSLIAAECCPAVIASSGKVCHDSNDTGCMLPSKEAPTQLLAEAPGPRHSCRGDLSLLIPTPSAPTQPPSPPSLIILYGAQGRHNFGDNLMGEVMRALLVDRLKFSDDRIIFADYIGQDMRLYGGRDVYSITDVIDCIGGRRAHVIDLGGETGGCDARTAQAMLLGDWSVRERKKQEMAMMLDEKHRAIHQSKAVYVSRKEWFANPGVFITNTMGGANRASRDVVAALSRDKTFASFRDAVPQSVPGGVLAPDSVVMLKRLCGRRVEAATLAFGPAFLEKRYIALQMREGKNKQLGELAAQVAAIARREQPCDVVLFRAGAAYGHDTLRSLRDFKELLSEADPMVTVQVFQDINIWSIAALIANAELVISTSLHVRIVAFAYAVPRMYNTAFKGISKYEYFVNNWDNSSPGFAWQLKRPLVSFARDWNRLKNESMKAYRDTMRSAEVADKYESTSFNVWSKLLSGEKSEVGG